MPWLETAPVDERRQFIPDALSNRFTMSELCARDGISRRIGYKWLEDTAGSTTAAARRITARIGSR